MMGKVFAALCLQAILLQSISGQICGPRPSSSGCGCSNNGFSGFSNTATYSTGGPVTVTCTGPLSTNGVSLLSDLSLQGQVDVCGTMPFLSGVVLEGTLASSGSGTVAYGCGDGNIVILQESGNPSGNNAASNSGLTLANVGGCGCRF